MSLEQQMGADANGIAQETANSSLNSQFEMTDEVDINLNAEGLKASIVSADDDKNNTTQTDEKVETTTVDDKTTDTKTAEEVKTTTTETTKEQVPTKSFDELLAETSGGKFKSWKDIEEALQPKEVFADEEIKTLNELRKQGVKFDKEFWDLQSKDFANMKDPDELLKESMRRKPEYAGWTERELQLEIDDKYRRKDWSDEGEEPNETEILNSKRLLRDAELAKQELIKLKESMTIVKQPDTKAIEAQQKALAQQKQEFEKFVDAEIVGKTSKLTTILDEKTNEAFDFIVTDADKADAAKMLKELYTNANAFWNQFIDAEGKVDYKSIYEMLLWNKGRSTAFKAIYQDAKAKGAEAEIKALKNTNFKAEGKPATQPKGDPLAEGLRKAYGMSKKQ